MPANRREFIKNSLLAGAVVAGASRAAPSTPPGAAPASAGPSAGPEGKPKAACPVTPYGSGTPIYLADLDRCQPASALARKWQPNRWKLYDFEAGEVKGVMIAAGQNTGTPDLEYALAPQGCFAIHFGIVSKYWESRLQVRLKRDRSFAILTPNTMPEDKVVWTDIQHSRHSYRMDDIEELFWKIAVLDGRDEALIIRQLKTRLLPGDPDALGNLFLPCWLAYIKLVPLTADEQRAWQADLRSGESRRLFAADDAFSATGDLHFETEDDVRRQIEPYRDTDFSRIYWEAGAGDLAYFPSKVGRLIDFSWMPEAYRQCDRLVGRSYGDFRARGVDPFRVALEASHGAGLEFHASYRVAGFHFPAPEDEWNSGGLYDRHPEWRAYDRLGRMNPRLSYAHAGVREFVLALLAEVAAYPVDGICLLYNRRLPILGYEPPLVESFRARHGIDPRTLPGNDPRWLAHSAAVLTGFMRELRSRLAAQAARQNRRSIGVTAVVMSSKEENYGYGLDLEAWVREGLVDTLVPYASTPGIKSSLASWEDPAAAEFFIRLTRGTACKLALNIMPRSITAEEYKRRAHRLYQAGVDHLFFWDCFERTNFDSSWSALRRLGHRQELAEWHRRGCPPTGRPRRPLSRIGDWDLSYQTPG